MADWVPPEAAKAPTAWVPPEAAKSSSIQLENDPLPPLDGLRPGPPGSFSAGAGKREYGVDPYSPGAEAYARILPGASSRRKGNEWSEATQDRYRAYHATLRGDPVAALTDYIAPNMAVVGDTVSPWGLAGMVVGGAAGFTAEGAAMLEGLDRKAAAGVGLGVFNETSGKFQILTQIARKFSSSPEPTTAEEALGAITEVLTEGTDWVESVSGGAVKSEELQMALQGILGKEGMKAYKWDGRGKAPKGVREKLDENLAKTLEELSTQAVEEGIPRSLQTGEYGTANAPRRAKVKPRPGSSGIMGAPGAEGIPGGLRTGEGARGVPDPRRAAGPSNLMGEWVPPEAIPPELRTGEGSRSVADPRRPSGPSNLMGEELPPEGIPSGLQSGEGGVARGAQPGRRVPGPALLEVLPEEGPKGLSTGEGGRAAPGRPGPRVPGPKLLESPEAPVGLSEGEGGVARKAPDRRPTTDSGVMGVRQPKPGAMYGQGGKIDSRVLMALGLGAGAAALSVPIIQKYFAGEMTRADTERELDRSLRRTPRFHPEGDPAPTRDQPLKGTPKQIFDWIDSHPDMLEKAGLGLGAIMALGPKTPLREIHPDLSYTTKVLTDLNDTMGGRDTFTREHILQRAARPNVSKWEREMFEDIVKDRPTISAKDLVAEVKQRTGDFELKPVESQDYADYGLAAIDRVDPERGYDAMPGEDAVPARTTIYQSPVELGTANHFSDPNYFAHTRSFDEGGVRHVVEIQSDVAQKAGRELTAEEKVQFEQEARTQDRIAKAYIEPKSQAPEDLLFSVETAMSVDKEMFATELEAELGLKHGYPFRSLADGSTVDGVLQALKNPELLRKGSIPGTNTVEYKRMAAGVLYAVRTLKNTAEVRAAEHRAKVQESSSLSAVRPMLKDWWKRIIREEVGQTAKENPTDSINRELARIEQETAEFEGYARKQYDHQRQGITLDEVNSYLETLRSERERWQGLKDIPEVVRFATADTVAKVEGWPLQLSEVQGRLVEARYDVQRWRDQGYTDAEEPLARYLKELKEAEAAAEAEPNPPRFRPEHQSIYDRYKRDIERYLTRDLKGKPYTDPQGHTWIEVPLPERRGGKPLPTQMGGVDPAFLKYAGAVGASFALASYLTNEDPPVPGKAPSHRKLRHAGAAAAATALAGMFLLRKSSSIPLRDAAGSVLKGMEDFAGNMSYQLEKISAPALRALRQYDRLVLTKTHDRLQRVAPWVESFRNLPQNTIDAVSAALFSGNFRDAVRLVPPDMQQAFAKGLVAALKVVEETGGEASALGLLKEKVANYFPRRVSDYEGLMAYAGKEARTFIEKMVADARKKAGRELSETEHARVLNAALRTLMDERHKLPLSSNLRKRGIKEITEETAKFYEPAAESLISYLRSVTASNEQARFFGKHIVRDSHSGAINLDASIGNVMAEELAQGKIDPEGLKEATRLLTARFGQGERGMNRIARAVSGATSSALLANPFSAMANLQDIANNIAVYKLLPTAKAVATIIRRSPERIGAPDMGLADSLHEQFVGGASTPLTIGKARISMSWFVEKTMRRSGFSFLDLFGKEITLNASVNAARNQLRSAKGDMAFSTKHAEYFGDDLNQLKADLKAGRKTNLTLEYAFRELADMQPVSRSEMPTAYLKSSSGRLFWQMKSYAIKQLTMVRKRGFDEIRKGNIKEGTEFLLRYGLLVGAAGATVDYAIQSLLGHDEHLEASDIPTQVLKNFGMSQMLVEKAKEGKLKEAAAILLSPAAFVALDMASKPDEILKYVPLVGRWLAARQVDETGKTRAQRQDEAREKRKQLEEKRGLERQLGMKL